MKTKYILHRRLFNPEPEQKNVKTLIATFGRNAEAEAKFILAALQKQATTLIATTEFSEYRYTLQVIPDAPTSPSLPGLRIDSSKARKTGRPIAYNLTWDVKHGRCFMLAYHKLFGSIRAEVDDSVEARQFFVRAISNVWKNGQITTK